MKEIEIPLFEEAWKVTDKIPGKFRKDQGELLYPYVISLPKDCLIVEVGSYMGRSTSLWAQSKRGIIAIDPLLKKSKGVIATFKNTVKMFPNITWKQIESSKYKGPLELPIGFLFIDANHNYPYPLQDFGYFEKWLLPNAIVAFHDVHCPGVPQSASELVDQGKLLELKVERDLFIAQYIGKKK